MIRIETNAKNTQVFLRKAINNVMRSQALLAKRLGETGRKEVQFQAPFYEGTLKSKVALKVFPKTHKAEILMASQRFNEIALQNEFNIRGMRKLFKSQYPKLAKWAESKGVFQNKPFVIVGGTNTRLGKQNMFFLPAFMNLQRVVSKVTSKVLSQAITKIRG